MNSVFDVVIPAGGTVGGSYAARIGTDLRALAPLGTERVPVVQAVVDALRESGQVRRILGVGPPFIGEHVRRVDRWLPQPEGTPGGPENVLRGLAELEPEQPALVCTSDLPLLTGDNVRAFTERCRPDADLVVGLVGADAYRAAFPDAPASEFVFLRDAGPVTLACLFQVRPILLQRHRSWLDQTFAARKSQWRTARLLGPALLWRLAVHRLTLAAIVARGEQLLACRALILRDSPPALAFDIDTLDDYAFAHAHFGTRPVLQTGPVVPS